MASGLVRQAKALGRRANARAAYEAWRWRVRAVGDPGLPSIDTLLGREADVWQRALRSVSGPRVLLVASPGQDSVAVTNLLLALALTLRGARVSFLVCDGALGACERLSMLRPGDARQLVRHGPDRRRVCWDCHMPAKQLFQSLGLPIAKFSDHVAPGSTDPDASVRLGVDIEQHATAGALRYFKRADLDNEDCGAEVLDAYRASARATAGVVARLVDAVRPDCVVFHHGIYVPHGVVGDVCRSMNTRVVNWQVAYRKNTYLFSHHDTYHHTMVDEPVDAWADMDWDEAREKATVAYLESRVHGGQDWVSWTNHRTETSQDVMRALNLDPQKPVYALLTNVAWDAQLHFSCSAFGSQFDWLKFTLEWFARRQDMQLVVRVHPAELLGALPSRQPVGQEIAKLFPELPSNIRVVPPDSRLSTYALADLADAVLIYGTKTGIEVAARGVPVVVAGEAWVRNKGVTTDVTTPQHYEAVLQSFPWHRRLDPPTRARALRYAYHFFFRRMIQVDSVRQRAYQGSRRLDLAIGGLDDLRPGADRGLDVICDGILSQTPFIDDEPLQLEASESCK